MEQKGSVGAGNHLGQGTVEFDGFRFLGKPVEFLCTASDEESAVGQWVGAPKFGIGSGTGEEDTVPGGLKRRQDGEKWDEEK
jgi:hypothetical protein